MKKRLLSIVLVLCMTLSLCSCGKKEEESSENNNTVAAVEETETSDVTEEDASEPETEEPAEEPEVEKTALQKWWGGDWFGIMWFTGANGDYSGYDNQYWDAMATIDIDENGNADMLLWYEAVTMENPVANVQLTISENSGSGEMGAAISESGWMFVNSDTGNGDVKHADWIIDPMTDPISSKYGNDMIHIEGDYLDGTGEIYYHFFLRKWGTLWEDVAKDPEMLTPGTYEEWYKPMIEKGYAMPANVYDDGTVMMADVKPGESALINPSAGTLTASGDTSESGEDNSTDNASAADINSTLASLNTTYDGGELVLVDDEYCKIVIKEKGPFKYNDQWFGYTMDITNKNDFSMGVYSYCEEYKDVQELNSLGKGNTCIYNGQKTDTHFSNVVKPGMTMSDACLVVDGVTDANELQNVKGFIVITNNDADSLLENIPYSF